MKKRLMILVGLLAVLLAVAIPALAQEASPPPTGEGVAVTGVVEIAATDGTTNDYGIVDEASGQGYFLKGDTNFGAFEGQRVTAYGVEDPESALRTLNVSRIVPAQGLPPDPSPDRSATPPGATTPDASGSVSPGSDGTGKSNSGGDGSSSSNSGGGSSGSGGSGSSGEAKVGEAKVKELPRTGGELPVAGLVGALLVGGGLLVRHAAR